MLAIPVSTFRYCNKEGLFFNLMRAGGIYYCWHAIPDIRC